MMIKRKHTTTESIGRVWNIGLRHTEVAKHGYAEEMEVSGLLSLKSLKSLLKMKILSNP